MKEQSVGYAAQPNIRIQGKFRAQGREVLGSKAEKSRLQGAIVSTNLLFGSHHWGGGDARFDKSASYPSRDTTRRATR